MKKVLLGLTALTAACICLSACGSYYDGGMLSPDGFAPDGNFKYDEVIEQDYSLVADNATSYFSLDRNTASYSQVRSLIENGSAPESDSVRIEEMINYFGYDYPAPDDGAVKVTGYLSDCPWNADNKLMLVGMKTVEYKLEAENANYVFLIDVSGSMSGDNRIGLAKEGLKLLTDELGDGDLVSIVTYASGVKTLLDGGECSKSGKSIIKNAISKLNAYGSTNGGDGLKRAYSVAQKHFITGGNNRVIIISDGDFNVGMSKTDEMKEFIQEKAQSGIYLSVLGVGMGNMRDDMLNTLATCGNGNYAYLDNLTEARKVLVDELGGTLKTVAKDAKAGVTFTDSVEKYRLIGYDTKLISEDDFNNDDADTGELGSNLCVSALYEIALSDKAEGKLADIEIKYKDVTGATEKNASATAQISLSSPSSSDLDFISCVAEFGLILRNSKFKGTASLKAVTNRLGDLSAYIAGDEYKREFVTLVGKYSEIGF